MLSQPTACCLRYLARGDSYILESRFCIFRHIIKAMFATYRQKICITYQTLHLSSHRIAVYEALSQILVSPVRHVEIKLTVDWSKINYPITKRSQCPTSSISCQ